MPCYKPITGYRSKFVNPKTGKRGIVFSSDSGYQDMQVTVPCGRCIGCRLEYSRQWAVRCMHEAQCHDANAFITLTYAPEHLPSDHSIHKEELQKFFKRLRKELGDVKIRYFACGEYGEKNNRPHYHAIIFGYDFKDKIVHTKTKNGDLLYRSPLLEKVWKKGHSLIGHVTFESAAYVARYVTKKFKGGKEGEKEEHYKIVDPETGEIHQLEPEFCLMSRRPGLGKKWLEKYKGDTDKDFITLRGKKMKLPKYYDSILEQEDELDRLSLTGQEVKVSPNMEKRKAKRKSQINVEDNTWRRLADREKVKVAQSNMLIRGFEDES
jgi:hypothetical protein